MTRPRGLGAAASVLAVLGLLGLGSWLLLRPPSSFDRARLDDLIAAGRFPAAVELLEDHLARRPDDPRAGLLAGRLLLDDPGRPQEGEAADAWDRRALDHLDRVPAEALPAADAALREVYRGKALFALRRHDQAEQAFDRALELDPRVPEAAWGLLNLYYIQERWQEAHDLALRQHAVEPDRRDRVKFLLELARHDVQPPDTASLATMYVPIVREHPGDLRAATRLGLALVRSSRVDEGLDRLRSTVEQAPDDPIAWDALLTGLDLASRPGLFDAALDQLPGPLRSRPEFAKHRARAAQERSDWQEAVAGFRRARRFEPVAPVLAYRLGRALRFAGAEAEAAPLLDQFADLKLATAELKATYRDATADPALGYRADPDLYLRMGSLRARMFRPDEAAAWFRLALEARPGDPAAEAAIAALGDRPDATSRAD